jgi:ABC-2 type transport system ATP-binding protein
MADNILVIQEATKKFKNATALDKVSVSFEAGKIHGIIGRNGSGKT